MQPNQDKDTVKEKLSIEEVVGSYVKLSRAGRNLRALCPFHKERTPSFHVSPERGSYYCFGCGEKGDIFTFVEKMEGVDFRTALMQLAERAGVVLTAYTGVKGPGRDEKERLFSLQEEATVFYAEQMHARAQVLEYLTKRGLTKETIETWRLGFAPADWRKLSDHLKEKGFTEKEMLDSGLSIATSKEGSQSVYDRFRGRIMFPIGDPSGRIIGFSGRFFEAMPARGGGPGAKETEEPAKYINSPETPLFHKTHVLYGLDKAKTAMRRSNFAILVEGQMDLLMMHQTGFTSALASSGTAFTPEHLRAVGNITKRLVLALDSDAAGVRSALKSAQLAYAAGFDLRVAAFPEGSDPADVGRDNPEELRRAVREAKTAIEFFLSRFRAGSKDERAFRRAAEESVIPLIASMESNIEQAHFSEITAQALGLPVESIRAEVLRFRRSKKDTPASPANQTGAPKRAEPIPKMELIGSFILMSEDDAVKARAREILGEERMNQIGEFLEKERDRILFTSEQEGAGVHDPKELLIELEKEKLREEIEEERATGSASLKLQELKRKLDEYSSKNK